MDKKIESLEQDDYLDEDAFEELKEEYAPVIGLFLMEFSSLEHSLNTIISDLINERSHQLGYVIVAKLSFLDKVELWFNLYNQRINAQNHNEMDKLLAEIKNIKKQLTDSNHFRNIIAHANWLSLTHDNFVRSKIIFDSEQGLTTFKKYKITPQIISNKRLECILSLNALLKFEFFPEHNE